MTRDFQVIPESMPLRSILRLIAGTRHDYFPVVDAGGHMRGALTFQTLREILFEQDETLRDLIVAKDIAIPTIGSLAQDDNLESAIAMLSGEARMALPVMHERGSEQVVGLIRHDDVIAAYNSRLLLQYDGDGAPQG